MKPLFLITTSALALAMTLSCTKESAEKPNEPGVQGPITEFKATLEETKTSFNDTTKSVSWKLGDEIAVIDEAGTIFKFVAQSAGAETVFKKAKDQEGELSGTTFYSVFPYTDALVWDNAAKTATVKTASARNVNPGDFGNAYAAIMTACTTTDELHFKNLSNLIKFTVPAGLKVKTIYLYAQGQDLSAKDGAVVSISSDGTPAISTKPSTTNGITISPLQTDSTNFTAGTYYIPVLPGDYTNLRCKLTYTDNSISYAFSVNAFTASRNEITNIGTLYDGRSFYKWLTFEDGKLPASITDKGGVVTIEDNPVKGNGNPSNKVYQSCTSTSTSTSSYITIDLSAIPASVREKITGVKFQIIMQSATKFYPRMKFGAGSSDTAYLPSTVNGKVCANQTAFNNAVSWGYWNTMEYKASLCGETNFSSITKIQLRPTVYYGTGGNISGPVTVQIDNIGFTYE